MNTLTFLPRRRLHRFLIGIALGLLVLTLCLMFLIATNPGARFLAKTVMPRVSQGMTVAGVEGRLIGPLTLRHVALENKRVRVNVGLLRVDVAEWGLARRKIRVTELRIEDVNVEALVADTSDAATPAAPKKERRRPPPVALELGELKDAVLVLPDSTLLNLASARLGGTLDAYRLELEGRVIGRKIPEAAFSLQGRGDLEHFDLDSLRVEFLGGASTATAAVTWFPEVVWNADARVHGIDPSRVRPGLERCAGAVDMDIAASGNASPSGSVTRFRVWNLGGELQGFPLSGLVQGETAGKTVRLDTLDLAVGPIRLGAQGTIGETVMADFDLLVSDLAPLGPHYDGNLALKGQAAGPRQSIAIRAQATGEGLRQGKNTIERISLHANANTDRTLPFDATLDVLGFAADTSRVDSVRVKLSGTVASHHALLTAKGLQGSLAFIVSGGLVDSTWGGHIDSLTFIHPRSGEWRLAAPANLMAGRNGGDLDSLRLESESAALLASGSWARNGTWRGAMRLDGFDLNRVPMKLPENVAMVGVLKASADLNGQGKRTLGAALLSVEACTLMVRGPQPSSFSFGDLRLSGVIAESSLDCSLRVAVDRDRAPVLRLEGAARVPGFAGADSVASLPLDGVVRVVMDNLSLAEGVNPRVRRIRGHLESNLELKGTVGTPVVLGLIQVAKGGFEMPEFGLKISDLDVTARADPEGNFALDAKAVAGEGRIEVTGSSPILPSALRPLTATIKAKRARLVETTEMLIDLDSDLSLRATPDTVRMTGEIGIPEGSIVLLESPPSAIAPSPDVRFVGSGKEKVPPAAVPDVDVRVTLGEGVFFRGLNYATRLQGSLQVRQLGTEPTQGTGEVHLIDGYYRAYGQDLKIDRGRAFFSGLLINPGLDVVAFRVAQDGTEAGVKVTGTADEMIVSLYTEPSREQRDAIAYIMTGQPLSANSGREQSKVADAAAVIGSNVLTNQMGSKVGLDEARVEGGNSLEEASLVVGKYLNPRLFVSYGMGLFDRASSFRARYLMTTRWALQTEAGTSTGADVLFRTESGH